MKNIYLIPYADGDGVYITSVRAECFMDAEQEIIREFNDMYQLDIPITEDYRKFLSILEQQGILLGDIYEKCEF